MTALDVARAHAEIEIRQFFSTDLREKQDYWYEFESDDDTVTALLPQGPRLRALATTARNVITAFRKFRTSFPGPKRGTHSSYHSGT